MSRTVIACPDALSVDDGLPPQELVLGRGAEALDARLGRGLLLPGGELAEQALGRAAGGARRHDCLFLLLLPLLPQLLLTHAIESQSLNRDWSAKDRDRGVRLREGVLLWKSRKFDEYQRNDLPVTGCHM